MGSIVHPVRVGGVLYVAATTRKGIDMRKVRIVKGQPGIHAKRAAMAARIRKAA